MLVQGRLLKKLLGAAAMIGVESLVFSLSLMSAKLSQPPYYIYS